MCAHRLEFSLKPTGGQRQEQELRRIALIVDWPDAANISRPLEVDFEGMPGIRTALARDISVDLAIGDRSVSQTIELSGAVEDLEPDSIARQIAMVQRLQSLRKAFKNNDRAEEAATELREFLGIEETSTSAPEQPSSDDSDDSFESLLGGKRSESRQSDFVSKLLEGSGETANPDRGGLIEQCDSIINDLVRQALTHPDFRRAERSIRGIDWLASELELGETIALWLLPVDLTSCNPTTIADTLRGALAGAEGGNLAALAVDALFEDEAGLETLAQLATIAQSLATTLLCKAPAGLAPENTSLQLEAGYPPGNDALQSAWQSFRATDQARHCAAVLPRFLLRQPYGVRGEAVYLPGFEELDSAPDHEDFLWISPVYALVYLLGGAGTDNGLTIESLPMPIYDDGSGDAVMPCAEVYLSEADVAALQQHGIMALQSYRNRNAVTLSGFSTLA